MRAERKGFTLVEMIVAMAVLGIVLGEIGMVLSNTTKIYSKGSYEISLQAEAQQAVQAMEDIMIDATKEIKKVGDTIVVTNNVVGGTPVSYTFALVQHRTNRNYKTLEVNGIPVADYVKSMDLDTSAYATKSKVTLKLDFEGEGGYQYSVSKDIYNRNEIGTGGTDPDDLTPGDGQKEINVLRYHLYRLKDYLPYDGRTWVSAAFTNTEAANYYELDSANLTLISKNHLNQLTSSVGKYDIVCKASDDTEYKISVYSETTGVDGMNGDGFVLYVFAGTTNAPCRSYFPIKGYDVTKATSCKLEFYIGGKLCCEQTLTDLTNPAANKTMSISGPNWLPNDTTQTYHMQFDGGVTYSSEFVGNNAVLTLKLMNNVNGYMQIVDTYNVVHWLKATLTFPDGSVTFKGFLNPLEYNFTNTTLFNKYWSIINSGGGTHSF